MKKIFEKYKEEMFKLMEKRNKKHHKKDSFWQNLKLFKKLSLIDVEDLIHLQQNRQIQHSGQDKKRAAFKTYLVKEQGE